MKTTLPFRIEADGQPSFASTVLAELRESSKALLVRVLKANDNTEGVVADAGEFENLIKDLKGGPNAVFKLHEHFTQDPDGTVKTVEKPLTSPPRPPDPALPVNRGGRPKKEDAGTTTDTPDKKASSADEKAAEKSAGNQAATAKGKSKTPPVAGQEIGPFLYREKALHPVSLGTQRLMNAPPLLGLLLSHYPDPVKTISVSFSSAMGQADKDEAFAELKKYLEALQPGLSGIVKRSIGGFTIDKEFFDPTPPETKKIGPWVFTAEGKIISYQDRAVKLDADQALMIEVLQRYDVSGAPKGEFTKAYNAEATRSGMKDRVIDAGRDVFARRLAKLNAAVRPQSPSGDNPVLFNTGANIVHFNLRASDLGISDEDVKAQYEAKGNFHIHRENDSVLMAMTMVKYGKQTPVYQPFPVPEKAREFFDILLRYEDYAIEPPKSMRLKAQESMRILHTLFDDILGAQNPALKGRNMFHSLGNGSYMLTSKATPPVKPSQLHPLSRPENTGS